MQAGAQLLAVYVPSPLHKRAKIVAKRHRTSMAMMVRTSLEARLDEIEEKEREEAAREAASKTRTRATPGFRSFDQREAVKIEETAAPDRLAAVFEEHAARIVEVFNQPTALAMRQDEAFRAIKRLAPLSYGDNRKIVSRLESIIASKVEMDSVASYAVSGPPPSVAGALQPPPAEAPSSLASFLAPLARILSGQGPEPADDFTGKSLTRVRTRGMIEDTDPQEKP